MTPQPIRPLSEDDYYCVSHKYEKEYCDESDPHFQKSIPLNRLRELFADTMSKLDARMVELQFANPTAFQAYLDATIYAKILLAQRFAPLIEKEEKKDDN